MMDEAGETKDRRERGGRWRGTGEEGRAQVGGKELERETQSETEKERGDTPGYKDYWVALRGMERRGKR